MWVAYLDIKICRPLSLPEPSGMYVKTGIRGCISTIAPLLGPESHCAFQYHETASSTDHCVINVKCITADTRLWEIGDFPVVPHLDCIFKFMLV